MAFFFFFHSSSLVCLYWRKKQVTVCVFPCLSVPSPLLAQVLSGELQQSCRSTGAWFGLGGYLCVCVCLFSLVVLGTATEILLHCDLFA